MILEELFDAFREGIPFNYLPFRNIKNPSTGVTKTATEVQTAIEVAGRVSSDDTTPMVHANKFAAGPGITITTLNPAGNEQLEISSTGSQIIVAAGSALSALRVVRPDAIGRAVYASSNTVADAEMVYGMTITAAAGAGLPVTVLLSGYYTDASWAWDLTKPIWLGVNGVLTQTSPATGFTQAVARPLTATSLEFGTHQSFIL